MWIDHILLIRSSVDGHFDLFPLFGSCEQFCGEHLCTSFCAGMWFLHGHVVFAHVPQSGVAGSCGYSVLKGTVLSHPLIREAARKGEVIKKVKPGKGVYRGLNLRTPTPWQAGRPTELVSTFSSTVVFPALTLSVRMWCDNQKLDCYMSMGKGN